MHYVLQIHNPTVVLYICIIELLNDLPGPIE